MDEPFILDVNFQGKVYQLETRLIQAGYTYKFQIMIDETEWLFERDDEGEFRALLPFGAPQPKQFNKDLLQATAETLEVLLS